MPFLYVTPDNDLYTVNWDGSQDKHIASAGKVFEATSTDNPDNGQVWVLSKKPDPDFNTGGDFLKVSYLDDSLTPLFFSAFEKPGGKDIAAVSIAAGKNGCYYIQEDGSVNYVDRHGKHKNIFPADTAHEIHKGYNGPHDCFES